MTRMTEMNRRLDSALTEMREMRLTPAELDGIIERYEGGRNSAYVIIHTAATMLRLEVEFGGNINGT